MISSLPHAPGSPDFTNEVQHLSDGGAAMGCQYGQLFGIQERCEIARRRCRRAIDPANRGKSGSRAIEHCSGAETQPSTTAPKRGISPFTPVNRPGHGAGPASKLLRHGPTSRLWSWNAYGQGWSPQEVAGRLAREEGRPQVVSHETIYRFIAAQISSHQGLLLAALPPPRQEQARPTLPKTRQLDRGQHPRPRPHCSATPQGGQ